MLKGLLLPPLGIVLLLALTLALLPRRWRLATTYGALALFGSLSLDIVSTNLLRGLEVAPAIATPAELDAEAIVVLSAGMWRYAPDFGGPTLDALSLQRVRYGARLHRATGLPILVTGGGEPPVADLMAKALQEDFRASVRWVEPRAGNTWQNATESAAILRQAGIRRVALVTHAWHMRRARWCFEAQGLEAVPAGTGFARPLWKPDAFVPSPRNLVESFYAFHEWVGLAYYRLRFGAG